MNEKTTKSARKPRNANPGTMWPAANSEKRAIGDLKLDPENPRRHSLEQIEQIAASMRRFGFVMPVLVDETGTLIAGHGRVRAARLMGWTDAPVVVARGWSEDQKRAYRIADNEIAARSDWDPKMIRADLKRLAASDFDLNLLGFSTDDLAKFMLDPASKPTGEAKEVTMIECPTCGRMNRKRDE